MKACVCGLILLSLCAVSQADEFTSVESRLKSRFQWKQDQEPPAETITLAELFAKIHREHQIRIRLDRAVSNLMVTSLTTEGDSVAFGKEQQSRSPLLTSRSAASFQTPRTSSTPACPTCPLPAHTDSVVRVSEGPGDSVLSPTSSPANSQPHDRLLTVSTRDGAAAEPQSGAVEAPPVDTSSTAIEREDEESTASGGSATELPTDVLIPLGIHETIFDHCAIPTRYLDDSMTVEQVIRAAISQIGTMLDASGERDGIPASYSHAWDWDLMVRDETVFITTKLQSNLHKIVRVYPVPKSSPFTAEELAACLKVTIRPWSWRDQIDKMIDMIKLELPSGFQFPQLSAPQVKLSLTGEGNLISYTPQNAAEPNDSPSPSSAPELDPSATWAAMKAIGSLFSSGTKAFAHSLVYTTEMLHYADPPTSTITVLPNMLIITQSRGAHQEIAELLDQIAQAAAQ